jgi:phosphoadenosine phosphosulfate reductase
MSNQQIIEELSAKSKSLTAFEILTYVVNRFGDSIAFASSLGAEDQVITDMLTKITDKPNIFTLDTGRLPEETYQLIDATNRKYGIKLELLFPDTAAVEQMVNEKGPNLFRNSVEDRKLCCRIRKIQPLKRKLATLDAWICGLRAEQSVTRKGLSVIEWDDAFGLIKINPLADWTTDQVWDYIKEYNVPYNFLHDKGFPSIGCEPCTRAVEPGQDIRAGRWWWESPEHKECGLHLARPGAKGRK